MLAAPAPAYGGEALRIKGGFGSYQFSVDLADEPAEWEKGLQGRDELPKRYGMLFVFEAPRAVAMWMKGTKIPLDMIFIDAYGRILNIARNTEPESLKTILSEGMALAVLEVAGGTAEKLGIAPGDRVVHPLFKKEP